MATGNPILDAAYSSAANTSQVVADDSNAIVNARTSQAALSDNDASLQLDVGANNAIINQVKGQAALQQQAAALKAGAIFGTNIMDQGEQISGLAQVQANAYQQKMSALQDIQAKDSVGFMDNPLQYIVNQFSVNDDIRKHNAALDIQQAAGARIDELNQQTNATVTTQKNFEINVTQAAIDAGAKNTLDTAQIAANKAEMDGLGYNIDGLTTAVNASKEQTALNFQVLGAQNAQQQVSLAMQNFALHKQEFQWQQDKHDADVETDEMIADRIQSGLKVMYGDKAPDLTSSPKLTKQYLTLLKSNTPAGKEATDAYMAGQTGVIGGNPAQVIDSINSGISLNFTPAQEPVKKILDLATQTVQQGVAQGTVTKANYQAALNQAVASRIADYSKDIEPGSATNPFNIGAVGTLIQMPGVNTTPLAATVLAPAVAAGAKFDDPKQVYATALDAVNKGTISLADAADGIVSLYQKGVATNLQARQLTKFGIVAPNMGMSYNTQIQTNPNALFGGNEIVNLTDKNAVMRAMNKTLASSAPFFAD